jgi:hypothetical protein
VFEPLDCEDDEEGEDGGGGGVDPEVAVPDVRVAGDLKTELDGDIGDDEPEECLGAKSEHDNHHKLP